MRDQDIFLKGRTGFWLSLLEFNTSMFGYGAGTSINVLTLLLDKFGLPHNDFLRISVDYGLIPFVIILFSLWKNSLRGSLQLFATSIITFYMMTVNPLSFPKVIVSYLLVLNSYQQVSHPASDGFNKL